MAALDDQILEQNPWWADPTAIDHDRCLLAAQSGPLRWRPPVLDALDLAAPAVHTLRGPRQVGKTTSVKMLVQQLVRSGEPRVLYFAFDLAADKDAIAAVLEVKGDSRAAVANAR
jgi:predicted AAA+ superfamily ATPase